MTSEELQTLLDAATPGPLDVCGHRIHNGHGYTVAYLPNFNRPDDSAATAADATGMALWPTIAAELIAARAKLAAAERLAEAVRNIDESCLISDPEELGDMARAAITAWEAAK